MARNKTFENGPRLGRLNRRQMLKAASVAAAGGAAGLAPTLASRRGYAYQSQAFARTLRNVAADLDAGDAVYLDGIRTRTQVF